MKLRRLEKVNIDGGMVRFIKKLSIIAGISFLLIELAVGHYYFIRAHHEPSAIGFVIKLVRAKTRNNLTYRRKIRVDHSNSNPFLAYRPDSPEYKYHPFIDYTRFHGFYFSGTLDYFGFRNHKNLYFTEMRDPLVIITGGSEAAGSTHHVTIAENLERILRRRTGKNFHVLNLAMNSYTLANEINAYVQLGFNLHPQYVISHSGWNDIFWGLMIPGPFKRLGLIYLKKQETWLSRFYDLKEINDHTWAYNPTDTQELVASYKRGVEKYRRIVKAGGGELLVGIQPYNPRFRQGNEQDKLLEQAYNLYANLIKETRGQPHYLIFSDHQGFDFTDCVHTVDKSSELTAEIYADTLLSKSHRDVARTPSVN